MTFQPNECLWIVLAACVKKRRRFERKPWLMTLWVNQKTNGDRFSELVSSTGKPQMRKYLSIILFIMSVVKLKYHLLQNMTIFIHILDYIYRYCIRYIVAIIFYALEHILIHKYVRKFPSSIMYSGQRKIFIEITKYTIYIAISILPY